MAVSFEKAIFMVLKSKCGLKPNAWDTLEAPRVTYRCSWKYIAGCYEEIYKHVKFNLVKGDRIRFWEDFWLADFSLAVRFPLLYRVSQAHDATTSTLRTHDQCWNLRFFRRLNERELDQVSSLIEMLNLFILVMLWKTEKCESEKDPRCFHVNLLLKN